MYTVLKGKMTNFLFSLDDMKERKSELIKKYPQFTFIWGENRHYSFLTKGTKVLFYLSGDKIPSGIIFEGELLDFKDLDTKYWPEGEWKYYMPIKVITIPKSVLESKDPTKWDYVKYEELKQVGFRPLPGTQKIDDSIGNKIVELLKNKK